MDALIVRIKGIAEKYGIEKLVLFGSRARGDHSHASDYDIAVFGEGLTPVDRACFCSEMDDLPTLKKIDVVFADSNSNDKLLGNIAREGIVIYEQAGNKAGQL